LSFGSKLDEGRFVVTAEISPPKGTDTADLLKDAGMLRGFTDAMNVTDNQRAIMRMSPVAACSILESKEYETIMHLTCRDRNRLALQSELLGAFALGVKNILIMSGDHPVKGDHEGAKPVYDVDSVQLLGLVQKLNTGYDFSGNRLEGSTNFCAGAVTNIDLSEIALIKLKKKINSGARFIQTQAVFDIEKFSGFLDKIKDIGFNKSRIIAGIIPLKSEKSARFLNKNIAGIKVPQELIDQMKNARNPERKGMEIAAELIKNLHGKCKCGGVHIMPIGNHEKTKDILEMAGIL
jgi:methylenetetrahydrofolate reductase (NADPH)